jgi:hypothetical protein
MDYRTSNGTAASNGQEKFRKEVKLRDRTCVMTGVKAGVFVQAAHIIPHSKSDDVRIAYLLILLRFSHPLTKYMSNLVNIRAERPSTE